MRLGGIARQGNPHSISTDARPLRHPDGMESEKPKTAEVVICGSLILDIMVAAPHLPGMAETAIGTDWGQKCGGRGGRQAEAAAQAGAITAMIGRVGHDDFGARLVANLAEQTIDHGFVVIDPERRTGMSVTTVDFAGDFGAVLVSGANLAIDADEVRKAVEALRPKVLILQNEIPEAVNIAAAKAGRALGATILYNAAPMRVASAALFGLCDVLVLDADEAGILSGEAVRDVPTAKRAMPTLDALVRTVLLTLGAEGLVLGEAGKGAIHVPAGMLGITPIAHDIDRFTGTLAASLAQGKPVPLAITEGGQVIRPLLSDQSFPF
jgi:ribokinase